MNALALNAGSGSLRYGPFPYVRDGAEWCIMV
jgi:hypothetical protein